MSVKDKDGVRLECNFRMYRNATQKVQEFNFRMYKHVQKCNFRMSGTITIDYHCMYEYVTDTYISVYQIRFLAFF